MPITWEIDREARLIRAAVRGDFAAADMVACVVGAAEEAGEAGYAILSDHREIGEPATTPQLDRMLGELALLRRQFAGARWAVVVSQVASYGMMRMLQALADRIPMTVRVFVDMARAERWARGSDDPDLANGDAFR